MERVGLRARLPRARWHVVRQRDPERSTLVGFERVDFARHPVRHHPLPHGIRIQQHVEDARPRGVDVSDDARRAHSGEANEAMIDP